MKADEIRAAQSLIKDSVRQYSDPQRQFTDQMSCWALHEIAAQLAELNETLKRMAPYRPGDAMEAFDKSEKG
jgi:hypothetical protein